MVFLVAAINFLHVVRAALSAQSLISYYTDGSCGQADLTGCSEALEREKEINRQIMQRKQEIEWQLIDALSQVPNICHQGCMLHAIF